METVVGKMKLIFNCKTAKNEISSKISKMLEIMPDILKVKVGVFTN